MMKPSICRSKSVGLISLFIAGTILILWSACITYGLFYKPTLSMSLNCAITSVFQTTLTAFLFTGMFITSHDSMHGTLYGPNRKVNDYVGAVFAFLFLYNWYPNLKACHHRHHAQPGSSDHDPDFHDGIHQGYFRWLCKFFLTYFNVAQFLAIGLTTVFLTHVSSLTRVVLFWMLPAVLSTLNLFYFGTYLPHGPDGNGMHPQNKHNARSLDVSLLSAFVCCYFFSYHLEHHERPWLPWWLLWKARLETLRSNNDHPM